MILTQSSINNEVLIEQTIKQYEQVWKEGTCIDDSKYAQMFDNKLKEVVQVKRFGNYLQLNILLGQFASLIRDSEYLEENLKNEFIVLCRYFESFLDDLLKQKKQIKIKKNFFLYQYFMNSLGYLQDLTLEINKLQQSRFCGRQSLKSAIIKKFEQLQNYIQTWQVIIQLESLQENFDQTKIKTILTDFSNQYNQLTNTIVQSNKQNLQQAYRSITTQTEQNQHLGLQLRMAESINQEIQMVNEKSYDNRSTQTDFKTETIEKKPQKSMVSKEIQVQLIQINDDYQLRVAHELLFGIGRPQQILKAMTIYEKLSEHNVVAMNVLGYLYKDGIFQQQNFHKSLEYYNKSSQYGDSEGCFWMGSFLLREYKLGQYYKDLSDIEKIQLGYNQIQKAAEHDHPEALNELGIVHSTGISNTDFSKQFVLRNIQLAESYFKKAVDLDFSSSMYHLGILYLENLDEFDDKKKVELKKNAFSLFCQAKRQNCKAAFYGLGKCFMLGFGVQKNLKIAYQYFKQGAILGEKRCQEIFESKDLIIEENCLSPQDDEEDFLIYDSQKRGQRAQNQKGNQVYDQVPPKQKQQLPKQNTSKKYSISLANSNSKTPVPNKNLPLNSRKSFLFSQLASQQDQSQQNQKSIDQIQLSFLPDNIDSVQKSNKLDKLQKNMQQNYDNNFSLNFDSVNSSVLPS